jgi:hypothetical protein
MKQIFENRQYFTIRIEQYKWEALQFFHNWLLVWQLVDESGMFYDFEAFTRGIRH